MGLNDKSLVDDAIEHLNNEGQDSSSDEHPDPSTQDASEGDHPAPQNDQAQEAQQTPAAQAQAEAYADLSKFQKVKIDGREMSIEDLKKSLMRQDDYTRKTQEAAKYSKNLRTDLETVRGNPAALAEFKRIYPKEYHGVAELMLQGFTPNQAIQQQAQPGQQSLPPELAERLDKHEQFLAEWQQEKLRAEEQALNANLEAIEGRMTKKYPYADSITAYTLAEQAREKFERESGDKMTPQMMTEQFLEPFFKIAHENQVKLFQRYQKEAAKQARANHERGSDIGRGGGTPGATPEKLKLKDVADYIMGSQEP